MNAAQIKEMHVGGMIIVRHSVRHHLLGRFEPEEQQRQLRDYLEKI